jgi:hypothetical protein
MPWFWKKKFLPKPPAVAPALAPVPDVGDVEGRGVRLPAPALAEARTPAQKLDALVVALGADHYEKWERAEDGVVSIALVWTNGDRITGQGATPAAAVEHLVGRARALGGGQ